MSPDIYTVGHSNHPWERFAALLDRHGIVAVIDVRSVPGSRWSPHFSRKRFEAALEREGRTYLFLGRELGARSDDPACYEDDRVRYDRLAATAPFEEGIGRVIELARHVPSALLCAENDPARCHRGILIGRVLEARGLRVGHIGGDGALEAQGALGRRVASLLGLGEPDLFRAGDEIVAEAYRRQGEAIAYRRVAAADRPT